MKNGLNKKEQIQVRAGFLADVPVETMAKKHKTSVEVIKRFTPKLQDEAAASAKKAAEEAKKADADRADKARAVKAALETGNGDFS